MNRAHEISDRTRRDPAGFLTIGRTVLANERTLLAFIRTSMTFLAMGIGLIKVMDHAVLDVLGWISVAIAGLFFVWGVHRYRQARNILKEITPADQQSAEREMGL